ncbi:MAG: DPP IV N-terminal domain-containing protein, partial [Chitinophagaceae bacterium]|nr:DPP IV N-terminal domain-containing protein [Chitinophagaceae bacterium]
MNKFSFLGLLFIAISSASFAQKKKFSMQQAVLGMSTDFKLADLQGLTFMGTSNSFGYIENNIWMASDSKKYELKEWISLNEINTQLKILTIDTFRRFPSLNWLNDRMFWVNASNSILVFTKAGNTWSTTKQYSLPKDGGHFIFHPSEIHCAFLQNNNLNVAFKDGFKKQLTTDGSENIVYGETVHRSEFGITDGTFWSPKGNAVAFYRMDQSMVTDYPIIDWVNNPTASKNVKYPFAGEKSHQVTVGVYNKILDKLIYLKTGEPAEQYLTNVTWSPDEKFIFIGVLNRDQNHLVWKKYDAETGNELAVLFEDKHEKYVEPLHPLFFMKNNQSKFVWLSQRDGFMHMYMHNAFGKITEQLTKGEWIVNDILGYNSKNKEIIFTGTIDGPLMQNVYAVNIETKDIRTLSDIKAWHTAQLSDDGSFLIDKFRNKDNPNVVEIVNVGNLAPKRLVTASNTLEDYELAKVEPVVLTTENNIPLFGKLIYPTEFNENKKYPVIVYLYNGPHAQMIKDGFPNSGNLWYDYMAQRGYFIFVMDGRGSSNRGLEFENATFRQLGNIEMQDQMLGVNYLKSLKFIDSTRMGIHGWSFGGFMTTSFMLRKPDVFKCGVAGGPVMDWKMYEIMYTERYMDSPEQNPKGYAENVLFDKIKNLKGKLLLIHGTNDDVVVWS